MKKLLGNLFGGPVILLLAGPALLGLVDGVLWFIGSEYRVIPWNETRASVAVLWTFFAVMFWGINS